jgi:hypothetical protein
MRAALRLDLLRRRRTSHQRFDPAALAAHDQRAELIDAVAAARIDSDPVHERKLEAAARQSRVVPVAPLVLQVDGLIAVRLEIADVAETDERDAGLARAMRRGMLLGRSRSGERCRGERCSDTGGNHSHHAAFFTDSTLNAR